MEEGNHQLIIPTEPGDQEEEPQPPRSEAVRHGTVEYTMNHSSVEGTCNYFIANIYICLCVSECVYVHSVDLCHLHFYCQTTH